MLDALAIVFYKKVAIPEPNISVFKNCRIPILRIFILISDDSPSKKFIYNLLKLSLFKIHRKNKAITIPIINLYLILIFFTINKIV